jgi:hypothetical protein
MPLLSIVIAATQPWPEVRDSLDAVHAQAAELGAEIIVAYRDPRGMPDEPSRYPTVRWLSAPGASAFQLRAAGLTAATGDIVAVTEDHCRVARDWCVRTLQAHREYPDAAVVGGAVENGATEHLVDWANFFIANGGFMRPIPTGPRPDVGGQANMSYKRWALPTEHPPRGMVEAAYKQQLRARGATFVLDDRIVVEHVQSLGVAGSCRIHFDDGRCSAGFRRDEIARREWLFQVVRGVALPLRVVIDSARIAVRIAVRKPAHRRRALLAAPFVALLLCFHAAGELIGYVAGPGDSPARLR